MKKLLIGLVSLSVLLVGFVPAQAAGEYVARQKTLSGFSGSTTTLTSAQRAEVKQAVDENPLCREIHLHWHQARGPANELEHRCSQAS